MNLKTKDLQILRLLQEDARLSNDAIGAQVGLSGSAVSRHIADMTESNIIVGARVVLDPAKLGLGVTVFTLVSLKQHGDGATLAFERELEALPNVVEWSAIVGSWDYLLKFLVADASHHNQLHHALLALPMVSRVRGMTALGMPRAKPVPLVGRA